MRPFSHTPRLLLTLACVFAANAARAAVRVEAFAGDPWGVAKVTVDVRPGASSSPAGDDRFAITERSGRVFYPVLETAPVRAFLRQIVGIESPRQVTFYFLFRGDEPLDLVIFAPDGVEYSARTERRDRQHRDLFEKWWREYAAMYERIHKEAEYPAAAQTYLTALWAERLGVTMPEPRELLVRDQQKGGTLLPKLFADEAYRANISRDLMLGRFDAGPADIALRPADSAPPLSAPPVPEGVELEAIAAHVPAECFYVRFGNFPNYLWFRDFNARWQGDLQNMVMLRSIRRGGDDKMEQMLALRQSALARVLGPRVISDVAIIGLDPYVRDGAAAGILFEARSSFLLARDIKSQREEAMEKRPDATETTVEIDGREVSYLSTKDGRVRSYYIQDGDYHLVCTSRKLIEKFLAAGQGTGSLAQDPGFIAARERHPIDGELTAFAFLSEPFFANLTSPEYRIELDRRLRATEEIRLLRLAQLTAEHEGVQWKSSEDLVDTQFLPESFGIHPDGSKLTQDEEGRLIDSLRGEPGYFVPIPDMEVASVSPAEEGRYAQFAETLDREAGHMPPIALAFHRREVPDTDLDHVTIDGSLGDCSSSQLVSWTEKLGPPTNAYVPPVPGDVVAGQVVLDGLLGDDQPIHVFGAVRDSQAPFEVQQGGLSLLGGWTEAISGYVGIWPRPHFLERFVGPVRGPVDRDGLLRTEGWLPIWVRPGNDFFVFSMKRDVLAEVGPQLSIIEDPSPAQVRLSIGDFASGGLGNVVSQFGYTRARQASAAGSRFMNSLAVQLGVPIDQSRELAEELIDGQFVCPLDGRYVLIEPAEGLSRWVSTAVEGPNQFTLTELPQDFNMPLLDWFRGGAAHLACIDDTMTLHVELDMVREAKLREDEPAGDVEPPADPTVEELPPPRPEPPRS
ncbi:MAG: hypothetical protein WD851_07975 [Pirellulales bacterium]